MPRFLGRNLRHFGQHQRDLDPKCGTRAGIALAADFPAHLLDKSRCDGEPKARTQRFTLCHGRDLHEILEYQALVFRRNPGACIPHFDAQLFFPFPRGLEVDTSL